MQYYVDVNASMSQLPGLTKLCLDLGIRAADNESFVTRARISQSLQRVQGLHFHSNGAPREASPPAHIMFLDEALRQRHQLTLVCLTLRGVSIGMGEVSPHAPALPALQHVSMAEVDRADVSEVGRCLARLTQLTFLRLIVAPIHDALPHCVGQCVACMQGLMTCVL